MASEPSDTVTLSLANYADTSQVTLSPDTLVFTTGNYDSPQEVTVTAVDDGILEFEHNTIVTLAAASTDTDYDGYRSIVDVAITDNGIGTYIDANASNTVADDATDPWYVSPQVDDDDLWGLRTDYGADGPDVFEAMGTENAPLLKTTISGLTPLVGYDIRVTFVDNASSSAGDMWSIEAGLSPTSLVEYSIGDGVSLETGTTYSYGGDTLSEMIVSLGTAYADDNGQIVVYVNTGASADRSWYDGVSYYNPEIIPVPKNNGYVPDGNAVLSWTQRISTASYDVYFGTDYNDVNDNAVWLADLDRSGTVGLSDLEILTAQWLTDPCSASPSADFDGDGIVDMADFAVIAGQWQQSSGLTYKGNQAVTTYDPTGTLDYGVYYWRIDEVDGDFVKKGQTLKFTVGDVIYIGVIKYINIVDPAANRTPLEQIITDLGGGDALRKGTYYDAQLIVSSDMGPNATHLGPGSYDFSKYIAYAELCKELGIKWSLQLSYHYAPGWYTTQCITDYGYDPRVRNEAGEVANGHFMPFSPSSPVWGDYCKDWAEAAVEALAPYMGTVIDDIMPGNEMMCNINIPTSYDEYTKQAWKDYTGNPSATLPIGLASTAQFQEFRSIQWYNAMKTLVDDVKNKTKTLGKSVKVSTKLVPYMLHSTWMLRSGIFPKVFDLIEEDSMDVIAVDFYPPTSHYYQTLYRRDKPMYLAEFNKGGGADCTAAEIEGWIQDGVTNYNMKYATFFAWDASGDIWDITEEEKTGLKNAADWVLTLSGPIVQKTDVVRYNISTAVLGEDADTAWTLNSDSNKRMRAAMALTSVLNPLSNFAYEIGVGSDPDAATNIYQVTQNTTIADTTTDKAIYLIEDHSTTVNITSGSKYVTTASSYVYSSPSYLVRNTENLSSGTQIYGSTPKWSNGNRKLTTNLSGYTRYVDTYNGYPLAIKKDNTFFLGQDTAWEIVDDSTDTPLDQLIADMLYDLGID